MFVCALRYANIVLTALCTFNAADTDAEISDIEVDMDKKQDTIMRVMSKLTSDSTPAAPELPDNISLPINSQSDLEML